LEFVTGQLRLSVAGVGRKISKSALEMDHLMPYFPSRLLLDVAAIRNRATSANKKGPLKISKISQIYGEYCYFKKITTWKTKSFLATIAVYARERYFLRGPISDSTGGPFLSSANV
jgi:hypothetical protein